MTQILKVIELPVEDYILSFVKNKSKIQAKRNVKNSIPTRLAQMLLDLANREFNIDIYGQIFDKIIQVMCDNNDAVNTSRFYKQVMLLIKTRQLPGKYGDLIKDKLFNKFVLGLYKQVEDGQKDLNKQTVGAYTQKCLAMQKLLEVEDKLGLTEMRSKLQS